MIREILRTIGFGCLLAGGSLYLIYSPNTSTDIDSQQLEEQITQLQHELEIKKKELAIAQTTSSVEENLPAQGKVESDSSSTTDSSASSANHHVLTIEPGSNSTIVAATLERAGIIENAEEFNAYLTRNGLSGKIQIGEHEIGTSMDYSAIAKIITTPK